MMVYPINDDVLISGYLQTTGNIYNNAYYNVLDNDGSTWINALLIANSSPNTDFHFVPNYVTQNGGTSRVFFGYASNWDSYNWMSGLDVNGNPIRLMTIDPSGVKVPSSRSVVPYSELEPCLWGLQYNSGSGQWDWTADSHELTIGNSIRFEDTVANKFLDLAAIRTDMNPEDATLWISRHLIVKKDFAVGGAATVFQGALVLGSDWDAHNPNAQMPQIMLAHSEGGSYPENPKRDILQIWRNGHLGFAHL